MPERGARLYHVTETGITAAQGEALAGELGVSVGNITDAGVATFVDPETHFSAPMRDVEPREIAPDEDYEEARVVSEVLDLEAIGELEAPSPEEAAARFEAAVGEAGILPHSFYSPSGDADLVGTGEAEISIHEPDGTELTRGTLHTRAGLAPELEGIPYVGPGATAVASFANVDGEMRTTSLRFAWRNVEQGEWVELLEPEQVRERCRARLAGNSQATAEEIELDEPQLVYYAPSLENPAAGQDGPREVAVETIVPHYTCGGTLTREGDPLPGVNIAEAFIPATDEPAYDPQVTLEAEASGGGTVTAALEIEGGQAPYAIEWHSTHNDLDPAEFDDPEIQYTLQPGKGADVDETIAVTVRDANGLEATADQTLDVSAASLGSNGRIQPTVGSTTDFGSESVANPGWGMRTNDKFERVMRNAGVTERFVWDGAMGWERDFRSPHDTTWADNADITVLSGHGAPTKIDFVDDSHEDGALRSGGEAHGDWGDTDLEWLTFASCQVLRKNFTSSGANVVQRWNDEFDGLHTLLGFHTNMQLWDGLGRDLAEALTGFSVAGFEFNLSVLQSWFWAIEQTQSWREGVAMGPIRGDGVSNYGDYFHGEGSVGPDIPQEQIENFWVLSESGYQHYDL